jgi:hypothetical protein
MHNESIQRYLTDNARATSMASWNVLVNSLIGIFSFLVERVSRVVVHCGVVPQQWGMSVVVVLSL